MASGACIIGHLAGIDDDVGGVVKEEDDEAGWHPIILIRADYEH